MTDHSPTFSHAFGLMPRDEAARAELGRRRKVFLSPKPDAEAGESSQELFVHFEVGNTEFGIDYRSVTEVLSPTPITPVPGAGLAIKGVMNYRSQLLNVIETCAVTRASDTARVEGDKAVIIVRAGLAEFGIWADNILGNCLYDRASAQEARRELVEADAIIAGVFQRRVTLLDVEAIFRDKRIG